MNGARPGKCVLEALWLSCRIDWSTAWVAQGATPPAA